MTGVPFFRVCWTGHQKKNDKSRKGKEPAESVISKHERQEQLDELARQVRQQKLDEEMYQYEQANPLKVCFSPANRARAPRRPSLRRLLLRYDGSTRSL
jgi:hypothetical protein